MSMSSGTYGLIAAVTENGTRFTRLDLMCSFFVIYIRFSD